MPPDREQAPPKALTQDLLAAARRGDSDAWEALYRRYRVGLLLAVRRQLQGRSLRGRDTEDILQSAFLRAWNRIQGFEYRGEGSFRAWLRTLVVHKVIERSRQGERERPLPVAHGIDGDSSAQLDREPAADDLPPPEILARREEEALLLSCLEELPELEREAIVLVRFEGKSWQEAAELLEVSRSTAQRAYRRGIAELTRKFSRRERGR